MNPFKYRSRGHLCGDDLDTLLRWSLRESVDGVQPPEAVWHRIAVSARAARAPRRPRQLPVPPVVDWSSLVGLGALVRLMCSRILHPEAPDYSVAWRQAAEHRLPSGAGTMWFAFSPAEILALGTHLSAARLL